MPFPVTVGVLALQGAFHEHILLLARASSHLSPQPAPPAWHFIEVRTPGQLEKCDALIIPGGESTTMSLVAERSGLLEPLRAFVKVDRKPTWGTCAGLILLAESANRTKKGGQELVGGLDVRVRRNHFGRQTESFEAQLELPFLERESDEGGATRPFQGVFIRAPVVEKLLPVVMGEQEDEARREDTVVAPAREVGSKVVQEAVLRPVEVMARLRERVTGTVTADSLGEDEIGDIVAVKQGNCFGTSFHPELADDERIHVWWLEEVRRSLQGCQPYTST